MEEKYIIRTEGLSKSFKNSCAVDDINLKVRKGDIYGLLGLNGAGKSTKLKMMLGFLNPSEGRIYINERLLESYQDDGLTSIGAMIEAPAFYDNLSGRKNLKIIAELYGEEAAKRVEDVLEIVEMKEAADKKVKDYSMGMKQRLGIARTFLSDPDLIILDEPTNGLDPYGMRSIRELIIRLTQKYNKTFLRSTHLLSEAELMCNRIGIIHNGQLIKELGMDEIHKINASGGSLEDTFISLTREERRYV